MSVARELPRVRADRSQAQFEPCLPRPAKAPPAGAGWIHEIKHDGFRIMARRDADGVRLVTRNGHDFSGRFPFIALAVAALPARRRASRSILFFTQPRPLATCGYETAVEPRAIYRTALTPTAEKMGRMALGPKAGAAVKLSCDEEVAQGLGSGEGVETVLCSPVKLAPLKLGSELRQWPKNKPAISRRSDAGAAVGAIVDLA
jgi:hypothetical protein